MRLVHRAHAPRAMRALAARTALPLVLLVGVVTPLTATADTAPDTPRAYAAVAPITLAPGEGLQRLPLPMAVLQQVRAAGLSDLRVFNADGRSVPMALVRPPAQGDVAPRLTVLPRFAWPAPVASSGQGGQGSDVKVEVNAAGAVVRVQAGAGGVPPAADTPPAMWLLDTGEMARPGERLAALRLDWPAQAGGVAGTVTVEASEDFQRWQTLSSGPLLETPAAPGSGATPPSLKRIEWAARTATARYLRVRTSPPLPLSEVQAEWQGGPPPAALDSVRIGFHPVMASGDRAPRAWEADTEGLLPLLPMARIELHLPQPNTVGTLQLSQRDDPKTAWRPVATLAAYRLLRDGQEVQAPPADLRAPAARHWRLSLPAQMPDIGPDAMHATLSWQPPQIVFAAQGSGPFQLAAGRASATPVALPLPTLLPGYQAGDEFKLPAAALGPVAVQAVPARSLTERLRDAGRAEHRKWALWAVLVAAVLGLGWLAWRLVGDMKKDEDVGGKAGSDR